MAADGYDQVREDYSAVAHTSNMVFGIGHWVCRAIGESSIKPYGFAWRTVVTK